jgi:dihydrofolate reductase
MIKNKKVGIIACCDITGLIGYDGQIPWHNSVDLKRFKELTMGTTLIMGRKTFESLPKKSLPGRRIHVLYNSYANLENTDYPEVEHYFSMLAAIEEAPTDLVWIAGGGQIYNDAINLKIADFIDLSIINAVHLTPIKDSLNVQKEKRIMFPHVDYAYRVVSEVVNEEDPKLFHRRYEIRPEWGWSA